MTLFDFGILQAAFGSIPNDPHWDARADLDGDEEVTLFDYAILMRNFGEIGAESLSLTLPRHPLPTSGYDAGVLEIRLDGWQGPPRTVRVEALCEDAPSAVYWKEVYTGIPFNLYLPDAGVWKLHISTVGGVSQSPRWGKVYEAGESIRVVAQHPLQGESFANASFDPGPIPLRVVPVDYDKVELVAADGTRFPANRERELTGNMVCQWDLVSGSGALVPVIAPGALHSALYYPPESFPFEEDVVVRCTVRDQSPVPSRRDNDTVVTLRFSIVNRPTLHISAEAHPNGGTPVASGYNFPVSVRFVAGARLGTSWQLADADVRWDTPWGVFTGRVVDVPVGPDESHRRFSFTGTATFRKTLFPPMEITDVRTASRILGFHKRLRDEHLDNTRGNCLGGPHEPQNWFDSRTGHDGHWGHALRPYGFDETAENLAGGYIVYYAPAPFPSLHPDTRAIFDWMGEFAPEGHKFQPAYRGRIYIFERPTVEKYDDREPLVLPIGLTTGGIDLVARCLVHEFAHRRFFIQDFGEDFSDSQLKTSTGTWKLLDPAYNADFDMMSNDFEINSTNQEKYHCNAFNRYSILEWFTGSRVGEPQFQWPPILDMLLLDQEMLARLWGEFGDPGGTPRYRIGDLDVRDWSVGGRQDY